MRIAIPIFRSRVSPVFDFSTRAVIIDMENGEVISREEIALAGLSPRARGDILKDKGINTLICAGLSMPLHHFLTRSGLRVIPGIVGQVDEVIEAYRIGRLNQTRFLMPGCCRGKKRKRHRFGRMN